MKNIFKNIFSRSDEMPKVMQVDPATIRASMPTVAVDELKFEIPTNESFAGAPQFHEDEWRQVEFFPADRTEQVKRLLIQYKVFEAENREPYGWRRAFPRQIPPQPILSGSASDVAQIVNGTLFGAPILHVTAGPLGQVTQGFSIVLGENVFLYGLEEQGSVTALGAILQGGEDFLLTQAFIKLSQEHGLLLVDWRSQRMLQDVQANGSISVWCP